MKITFVESDNSIAFEDLAIGEIFTEISDFTDAYLKIKEFFNEVETINAICLNTGKTHYFFPKDKLRPVEAELIVSDY